MVVGAFRLHGGLTCRRLTGLHHALGQAGCAGRGYGAKTALSRKPCKLLAGRTTGRDRRVLSTVSSDGTEAKVAGREMINFQIVTNEELSSILGSWGEPKFRSKQVIEWVREKGVTDPMEMTNLPSALRRRLAEATAIVPAINAPESTAYDQNGGNDLLPKGAGLRLEEELVSRKDDTIKRAYKLHDGQIIESVLMYSGGDSVKPGSLEQSRIRRTACISSQAGCAMGCVFCSTGQMGFARQLSSDEIFEQAASFASELRLRGDRLTHVVFMGMGEPLANYRNVLAAARRINSDLGLAARKITISTVGIPNSIRRLAHEKFQVNLAVSLHESDQARRSALLPANRRYGGLEELFDALREYMSVTNRRVSFEWALIRDTNDSVRTARDLGRLFEAHGIASKLCHVNVIPVNPTPGFQGGKPTREIVDRFCATLVDEFGISATPRVRKGIDIDAGCGQLKADILAKKKVRNIIG